MGDDIQIKKSRCSSAFFKRTDMVENQLTSRRQDARYPSLLNARLSHGDQIFQCRLKNISVGGAMVELDREIDTKDAVTLNLGSFGEFACEIIWKNKSRLGLTFLDRPEQMAEVIMGIAVYG